MLAVIHHCLTWFSDIALLLPLISGAPVPALDVGVQRVANLSNVCGST